MAEKYAEQFLFWNTQIGTSITELRSQLAANPRNVAQLADAVEGLQIDLETLQEFQPGVRKVCYDYAEALPNIAKAIRLVLQGNRALGGVPVQTHQVPNHDIVTMHRKIPELPIVTFTGKYADYQTFIKSFHLKYDKLDIPPAEKLLHLQQAVAGPPQLVIGKLQATDANYELALNSLEAEYDKSDQVLSEIHDSIQSIVQAKNTPDSLRSTYYQLEGLLATLRSHGEDIDVNPPLRDRIISKYPVDIVYLISGTDILTITQLQKAMSKYIAMRLSVQAAVGPVDSLMLAPAENTKKPLTSVLYGATDKPPAVKGKGRSPKVKSNDRTPRCAFCPQKHYSSDCATVSSLSARKAAIKDRCSLCF